MKKEEMKKIMDDIFIRYPLENKVFVTSDGQAFTSEIHAKNHAVKNRTGKELSVEVFLRSESEKPDDKTAEELISYIAGQTDVEAVQAVVDAEKAGKNRKSVIGAGNKKIVELTKP